MTTATAKKESIEFTNKHPENAIDRPSDTGAVITSYSIHYTKLYDPGCNFGLDAGSQRELQDRRESVSVCLPILRSVSRFGFSRRAGFGGGYAEHNNAHSAVGVRLPLHGSRPDRDDDHPMDAILSPVRNRPKGYQTQELCLFTLGCRNNFV